ncbi:uroporphyrinogen-III synthase [uncultured Roseovarius sp.]|uniref:uroporphyrinogen-III synthase n=1 Tax=uncultured Roseovarius sp. TaxID=293344 RepID=UPI0025CC32BA|nr:uroporphyrinogen-III synthase [uncultured Roseovarius sp.]
MTPSILITRPDPAGSEFATALRTKLGKKCTVCTSPIMQIETCAHLPDLAPFGTLIFTSRNGVEAFANLTDKRDIPAYAVGFATGEAARAIGLRVTIGKGDVKQLTKQIITESPPAPCLYIRGEHAASPLAKTLSDAGIETLEAVLYHQQPRPLSAKAQRILERGGEVILPLFSPRSAGLFFAQARQANWRADLTIVAISQAVADQVPQPYVNRMVVAEVPNGDAMQETVEQLWIKANRLEGR